MKKSDWLVTDDGQCHSCSVSREWKWTKKTYRLYRFLTDLEDILEEIPDDRQRLEAIRPLVRRLLKSSHWLQAEYKAPNPQRGWSIVMLYDEVDFPLTVETVAWHPGKSSAIHNHATWGVVALIEGKEKNTLWRRVSDSDSRDRIEKVEEKILLPGDIISFTADAIHSVEALGDKPAVSFNLYGVTDYDRRFQFDPLTHELTNF